VDSNVLIDILTEDPTWLPWSSSTLSWVADRAIVAIDPIIYAEVSIGFEAIEDVEAALPRDAFARLPLPLEAAFLAGKAFQRYRRAGGVKRAPLPDFYIGAHAAVEGMTLLTRDAGRYRSTFPGLSILAPET
jgi:hypothetical protein